MYTGPEQHGDHIETFTNTLRDLTEIENFYKKTCKRKKMSAFLNLVQFIVEITKATIFLIKRSKKI